MSQNRLSVGITGLNEVIDGGLIPQRSYLVRGSPGTGKTTARKNLDKATQK
ncbi:MULTISPECIES: ATPase domain-containing protein [unclassified Microcoleus]|uniref:ATPase domain-containing protein n=1 Tax=unclassified Microcoleus TaxID=2642155 RepID=UPI0025EEAF0C|nr:MULTISPECIES: ATPase domain-containing protein [unclassified Microcoleus]